MSKTSSSRSCWRLLPPLLIFVGLYEKSPQMFSDDKKVRREELAAVIISLAQRGESNKLRVANHAITILREAAEQKPPKVRVNSFH